jgi:nucleotide-binding universal stress UspA family protein
MTNDHRLVVALCGDEADASLIRYANFVADLNCGAGCALHSSRASRAARSESSAPVLVDQAHGVVLSAPQFVDYLRIASGRDFDRLLRIAAQSETDALLVSESLGRRRLKALVRRAASSVWFVPAGAPAELRRILLPVDFSVRSADCLRLATALACLSGAECSALHVYFNESLFADRQSDQELRGRVVQSYARFIKPIDTLGVPVTFRCLEAADIGRALRETADDEQADLIVLASRGRTRTAALLAGSVAEQMLRGCRTPSLIVKHFGAQLGLLRLLRQPSFYRRNDLRFG